MTDVSAGAGRDGRLPKTCECGGTLVYQRGPGDYIGSYCDRCTPVVTVPDPLASSSEPQGEQDRFAPNNSPDPIEHFWTAVLRGWDIEPREYFERVAVPMGFKSPVEMAVHHMWKRRVEESQPPASSVPVRASGAQEVPTAAVVGMAVAAREWVGARLDGDCPLGPNHHHAFTLWDGTQCEHCMQTKEELSRQVTAAVRASGEPQKAK